MVGGVARPAPPWRIARASPACCAGWRPGSTSATPPRGSPGLPGWGPPRSPPSSADVTGVPPPQWLLRARLRAAAQRLATRSDPVTAVALDVGFEDLSNFIRSFRAEFGVSPSRYLGRYPGRRPRA